MRGIWIACNLSAVEKETMVNPAVIMAVRAWFAVTSREQALRRSEVALEKYESLAAGLMPGAGGRCVEVPPMRGVDEDMRRWSFFMILEHNAIVNRSITATVRQLARGEPLTGAARIDPKTDVMPHGAADEAQVAVFRDSVRRHIQAVRELGRLRGTGSSRHPVFGDFDAHMWNCMFAFHLHLHLPQAQHVVRVANGETNGAG
jgi:hypothetical protein